MFLTSNKGSHNGIRSQSTERGTSGLALGTAESMQHDLRLLSKVLNPMGVLWSVSHCSPPQSPTLIQHWLPSRLMRHNVLLHCQVLEPMPIR